MIECPNPFLSPATYRTAHATGWDAGNKSMRDAGRSKWNEADHDAARQAFVRVAAALETARQ